MQRQRRRRERRDETLQQGVLFSHKANPMFDTTQTLTTTSSATRGEDFEVIRVPPGQAAAQPYTTSSQEYPADPLTYLPPHYTVCAASVIPSLCDICSLPSCQ